MEKSLSSLDDTALSGLIAESAITIRMGGVATQLVFERVSKFNQLYGLLAEKPRGSALVFRVPQSQEARFETLGKNFVVGRLRKSDRNAEGCDLAFPEIAAMSRRHFEIVANDGFLLLRDLGSRNGTHLNNEPVPVEGAVLKAGDMIEAGGVVFGYTGAEAI